MTSNISNKKFLAQKRPLTIMLIPTTHHYDTLLQQPV